MGSSSRSDQSYDSKDAARMDETKDVYEIGDVVYTAMEADNPGVVLAVDPPADGSEWKARAVVTVQWLKKKRHRPPYGSDYPKGVRPTGSKKTKVLSRDLLLYDVRIVKFRRGLHEMEALEAKLIPVIAKVKGY
jgi:hypothetical protein